ncbi:MAG: terminase small subunit [Peptostreptococcaceae bacterium]|nr:terminase small subunit [Peptostreptococcaceae bacterium]
MEVSKLTEKQKAFADYYIESFNATQSAIRAGYSVDCARSIGYENLTKPHIKSYIDERLELLDKVRIMKMNEALIRLSEKARGESYEEIVTVTQLGEVVKTERKISEKDQLKALELIGKYHKLFTDKVEANISQQVIFEGENNLED